jgi:hypothetical protein
MRAKCKRNNRQSGGGLGGGWGYVTPDSLGSTGTVSNPIVAQQVGNCREVPGGRTGYIANGYELLRGGLPGMRGGRRRTQRKRGSRKQRNSRKQRVQSGGRYGFVDASSAALFGGTPYTTGIAPMSQIPCEASRSQIPPSGAAGHLNLPLKLSPLADAPPKQGGGGGIGADVVAETVPTARYETTLTNPIQTAAGTLVETRTAIPSLSVNMPTFQNPACMKTGGGRKNRSRKNRSRKNRKANKKRGTRKH